MIETHPLDSALCCPDALQNQDCPRPVYGGLISAVLGTRLPGPEAVYVFQTLNFRAPVGIGDTVQVQAEVVELIPERHRARRARTCRVDAEDRPGWQGSYQSAICRKWPSLTPATILKPPADPKACNSSQPERLSAPLCADGGATYRRSSLATKRAAMPQALRAHPGSLDS